MGSLVEVGLKLQRPSLAMAEMSDSCLLPKMSTEGGVMLKPGSVGPLDPGGACHSSSRGHLRNQPTGKIWSEAP